jgi:hypothetical protein
MTRNLILANRLREVFLNGHWIANTNYKEQLACIGWEQAIYKIGTLNTIAALTFHVNYYLTGLLQAFENGKLEISDKYSFDLTPIASAADWNLLVTAFLNNAANFSDAIEKMDDSLFDQPFIDEKYGTYLRNVEGVIEHSYYHLGQIVWIKKMIEQNPL